MLNCELEKQVWKKYRKTGSLQRRRTILGKTFIHRLTVIPEPGGGAGGATAPFPQYFEDQLTLFEPGRADYPYLLLLIPPMFFTFRHHLFIILRKSLFLDILSKNLTDDPTIYTVTAVVSTVRPNIFNAKSLIIVKVCFQRKELSKIH